MAAHQRSGPNTNRHLTRRAHLSQKWKQMPWLCMNPAHPTKWSLRECCVFLFFFMKKNKFYGTPIELDEKRSTGLEHSPGYNGADIIKASQSTMRSVWRPKMTTCREVATMPVVPAWRYASPACARSKVCINASFDSCIHPQAYVKRIIHSFNHT